jgi:hypothetical protein
MAVVRHFALNLVRQVADNQSIKRRRKRAAWDIKTGSCPVRPFLICGRAARDRLRGWAYRIRTSMCREKIHLFDKSREFGFR